MNTFRSLFRDYCDEHGIDASGNLLDMIERLEAIGPDAGQQMVLDLAAFSVNSRLLEAICHALKSDNAFTALDFSDSFIGDDGCSLVCAALEPNPRVHTLLLRGNNIRHEGAQALGSLLHANNTIQSLSLEWNSVGLFDVGLEAVTLALHANKGVTSLDLRNNRINSSGAEVLAAMLVTNSTLSFLDLRWNQIGEVGARSLLRALQENRTLVQLNLIGNEVTPETLQEIESRLSQNKRARGGGGGGSPTKLGVPSSAGKLTPFLKKQSPSPKRSSSKSTTPSSRGKGKGRGDSPAGEKEKSPSRHVSTPSSQMERQNVEMERIVLKEKVHSMKFEREHLETIISSLEISLNEERQRGEEIPVLRNEVHLLKRQLQDAIAGKQDAENENLQCRQELQQYQADLHECRQELARLLTEQRLAKQEWGEQWEDMSVKYHVLKSDYEASQELREEAEVACGQLERRMEQMERERSLQASQMESHRTQLVELRLQSEEKSAALEREHLQREESKISEVQQKYEQLLGEKQLAVEDLQQELATEKHLRELHEADIKTLEEKHAGAMRALHDQRLVEATSFEERLKQLQSRLDDQEKKTQRTHQALNRQKMASKENLLQLESTLIDSVKLGVRAALNSETTSSR
jgi:hypothetical protein